MDPAQPVPTAPIADDAGDALATAALALARRFAHGATLWCIAPEWPEHARHVAVEFVHPVLVGKRALPAVSVDTADPVPQLRPLVRPGDIVLAIGVDASAAIHEVMRRAAAWGVLTVWIGVGPRPAPGSADHLIWVAHDGHEPESVAAHDGRLVLLYHVLWELTHVCAEHPGLLTADPSATCDDEVCITCSDEGRIGEIIGTDRHGFAQVRTARGIETIDTTIVAGVGAGDLVLIHAGAAIAEVP